MGIRSAVSQTEIIFIFKIVNIFRTTSTPLLNLSRDFYAVVGRVEFFLKLMLFQIEKPTERHYIVT